MQLQLHDACTTQGVTIGHTEVLPPHAASTATTGAGAESAHTRMRPSCGGELGSALLSATGRGQRPEPPVLWLQLNPRWTAANKPASDVWAGAAPNQRRPSQGSSEERNWQQGRCRSHDPPRPDSAAVRHPDKQTTAALLTSHA